MSGNSAICIWEEKRELTKVGWKLAFVVCISLSSLSHSFHKNRGVISGRALGKGPGDIDGTSLGTSVESLLGHRWDLFGDIDEISLEPSVGSLWDHRGDLFGGKVGIFFWEYKIIRLMLILMFEMKSYPLILVVISCVGIHMVRERNREKGAAMGSFSGPGISESWQRISGIGPSVSVLGIWES